MKLLSIIEPVEKVVGKIHLPVTKRLITGEDFYAVQSIIEPGDIVLSRTRLHLTNACIPEFWKHASIISTRQTIIEAIGEGVVETSLYDFCVSKDYLCVLRAFNTLYAIQAAVNAAAMIGLKYDYEFEFGDNEFYCSELVYWAQNRAGLQLNYGKGKILPSSFFHAINKLDLIYASDSCKNIAIERYLIK